MTSGSFGSVCDTRFCTSTCALSRSVPSANVTVSVTTPSLVDCDDVYSMSSTPLMACSSGDATVSAMTCGFAPGYSARTTTVGGTTSGYSLIGSSFSEMAPLMKMIADSTPAKIGRFTKKLEKFTGVPYPATDQRTFRATVPPRASSCASTRSPRSMATCVAATVTPGRTRCRPLTITTSSGCKPLVTTRRPSIWRPVSIGAVANHVAVVDDEHELASEIAADRPVVDERRA